MRNKEYTKMSPTGTGLWMPMKNNKERKMNLKCHCKDEINLLSISANSAFNTSGQFCDSRGY